MKIITEAMETTEKTQNGSIQPASTEQIILEAELDLSKEELKYHKGNRPANQRDFLYCSGLCGQIEAFYIILCWMDSGIHNI